MHYTRPIGSDGFYVNIKGINTVGAFDAVYIAFIICMHTCKEKIVEYIYLYITIINNTISKFALSPSLHGRKKNDLFQNITMDREMTPEM